jgi:hypothetical protein
VIYGTLCDWREGDRCLGHPTSQSWRFVNASRFVLDVGGRDEIGAQQASELFGVDAVIFVFAAVDEVQIEGVSQNESQALAWQASARSWRTATIPAEQAFGADGEAVTVGLDELEEVLEVVVFDVAVDQFLAFPIRNRVTQTYIWWACRSIPRLNSVVEV